MRLVAHAHQNWPNLKGTGAHFQDVSHALAASAWAKISTLATPLMRELGNIRSRRSASSATSMFISPS